MKERTYDYYNAESILGAVERFIKYGGTFPIREVYDELSIFDWWPENLNQGHLRQMRTFLRSAIKAGFKGYACFKVGASGCANGMWVSKKPTTDGYSPDGDCIYRSFTPDYTYWNAEVNGAWLAEKNGLPYDGCKKFKDLEALLAKE